MTNRAEDLGNQLFEALRGRQPIAPITDRHTDISIEEAYRASLQMLARREAEGEKLVGKKIGITSEAVQTMLNVNQPDFGFLTDAMWIKDGQVPLTPMIAPRAEAEIAFRLKESLKGPGIKADDVLQATETIMPCFEIVDSRIADWKIKIQDTIADNASCGVYVLGETEIDPRGLDLTQLKATVSKNGAFLSEGYSSAVQGSPLNSVAWLANTLGELGIPFLAGEIILSGSLVPLEPVIAGDKMSVTIEQLGTCDVAFI